MPVYPIERLPTDHRGHIPNMAKHDRLIWLRFLDNYADAFESFAYNVALGGPSLPPEQGTEQARLQWQYANSLKVDAVGFRQDDTWIIEVKPSAGVSAIGAALCYAELAQVDRFTDRNLVAVVVTDQATPDIRFCAEQLGVVIFELPEPEPAFRRLALAELERRRPGVPVRE